VLLPLPRFESNPPLRNRMAPLCCCSSADGDGEVRRVSGRDDTAIDDGDAASSADGG